MTDWETVIGLEVHAELATETKLFSTAANSFGSEPNTNIDPVTMGLPGSLPVLNVKALELSIRIGLALECSIEPCVFARKNYFYPDQPKNYQISQYDKPLNVDGRIVLADGKVVRIERAHVEEDTGKITHVGGDGRIHGSERSLIDYNRAGVPLLEIVSHPDIRSGAEARAYVEELRDILVAVGGSDGRMEEGSMRVDANVSVRPVGSDELRTRCEIKNLNSLRSLERAIAHEADRHVGLYEAGEAPIQETRHWDEGAGRTRAGRSKEEAEDYRYFPEPDLVPVVPDPAWVEEIRSALPTLPAQRRGRLVDEAGAAPEVAGLIVARGLDTLVLDAVAAGGDPARLLTHAQHDLAVDGAESLAPEDFASLTTMVGDGQLTATQAKQVLAEMVADGGTPADIAAAKGFKAVEDGALDAIVDGLIADNPDEWARYCDGDKKVQGFFVGQVMKATQGNADGGAVSRLLGERAKG